MKQDKIYYKLKKDLVGCPAGRLFQKRFVNDEYFHVMNDQEIIDKKYNSSYVFQKEEVEDNPEWFERHYPFPEHEKLNRFTYNQLEDFNLLEDFMETNNFIIIDQNNLDSKGKKYITLSGIIHKFLGIDSYALQKELKEINHD